MNDAHVTLTPFEVDSPSNGVNSVALSSVESTELAKTESLGFFLDIPDSTWKRHKERFRLTQPNYDLRNKKPSQKEYPRSSWFWADNFEPEFTCPHEFRLGKLGDGGKWVCDPHRIPKDSCLIYSIGSNGHYDFEVNALEHVSKNCEIHTFDLKESGRTFKSGWRNFTEEADKVNAHIYKTETTPGNGKAGVHFHHWGVGTPTQKMKNMKNFKEIFVDLHHENRSVDVMKIDCEKCEYQQFRKWLADWKELGMTVRQVQLEIHNSPMWDVMDLMNAFLKAGYVMFHKEANYMMGGSHIEAAFLLLSKDFQNFVTKEKNKE